MFTVDQVVNAKYVHANPYGTSTGSLKVYIPTLMPLITMSSPRITPISLNKTCYSNASDCRPVVSLKINTQNYVTALEPYSGYRKDCYRYGSDIAVVAKSADCLSCRLSPSNVDKSINDPNINE